jgi:toxin YoeB
MKIAFTDRGWDDYIWFQEHERKLAKRINDLVRDVARSPFDGIGKPEPLKGDLSGCWSRRIDGEHRLVYKVSGTELVILACRFHYER